MATTHSNVVGGSTAGLRLICNASIDESRKVPSDTNEWAARGTALHTVVERAIAEDMSDDEVLKTFTDMRFTELLSKEEEKDKFGHLKLSRIEITEKALPALAFFDDTVRGTWLLEQEMESRVRVGSIDSPFNDQDEDWFIKGGKGTGDVLFSSKKRAGLIDWKFGDGHIVDPEDSKDGAQFMFYLVLAIHNGILPERDEYEAHVFQPAAKLDPDQYHKKRIVTFDELFDFAWDLKDAVEAERKHVVGDHCRLCKGKTACQPYKKWLRKTVDTDIQGVTARELGELMDMTKALEAFVKEVKDATYRNALDGVDIPGWKLEDALGNRTWKDEQAAWLALGRLGLSADERTVKKPITAPQALAMLKEKAVIDKQIDRFEKRHIERPEAGQKLVKCKPGENASGLAHLAKVLTHE